jgi:mRNA interferase MazF
MTSRNNPKRGEVWLVNFDPQVGAEIAKARPAIVVNADAISPLELRIIVPITDWKDAFEHHWTKVRLSPSSANGLSKESAADAFQLKSVSLARFLKSAPLGRLSRLEMEDVAVAIRVATALDI